nr:hypothetical protein [Nitrosomonas nitrosa]
MKRFEAVFVSEPELTFGHGQTSLHPKDGLFLYGPQEPRAASEIRIGAIGSQAGIDRLSRWMKEVKGFLPAFNDRAHHSPFPGMEAAFELKWPEAPAHWIVLQDGELEKRIRYDDPHRRVYDTVDLLVKELLAFKHKSDVRPDLWMVVLPEDVSRYGRPKSFVPKEERIRTPNPGNPKLAKKDRSAPFLFDEYEKERLPYQYELNVHNQLKARLLEDEIVTQIVRETTLTPEDFVRKDGKPTRSIQDKATTAWNLGTTLYYKVAGPPWRLSAVRPDVCYIGLVYKVDPNRPPAERVCCGAQMFLATGEGVVFRGHLGPWDSKRQGEHHLDEETAKQIIREVVDSYRDEHGRPPKEIFIHGKTRFMDEEWRGFKAGAGEVKDISAVQIQKSKDIKLFREKTDVSEGSLNLLRGTTFLVNDRSAYLWTSGFVPRLETYPGWEVPNAYRVSIQKGDADLKTVLADVLGLTKLNFNSCIYGDGQPVTLRFADAIGEILTAGHDFTKLKPLPFKFYI